MRSRARRITTILVMCFVGIVTLLPSAAYSQAADDQATQCQVTPSLAASEDEFVFLGSGTGAITTHPEEGGPVGMLHQSIFQATCWSFGQESFSLKIEITFQRCVHGCFWEDVNEEPLVCETTSVGDTAGVWVAHLEAPSTDCEGSLEAFEWQWPSLYRAHMELETSGVAQPTRFEGTSLPYWVGI